MLEFELNCEWLKDAKQQKFGTLRPFYLPGPSALVFIAIGLCVLATGIGVLQTTNENTEIALKYSEDCMHNATMSCDDYSLGSNRDCLCTVPLTLTKPLRNDVVFFYGLDKFYQNNRWYFHSRDDSQLAGNEKHILQPSDSCEPFLYETFDGTKKPFVPCGALANSIFNDTFQLTYISKSGMSLRVPINTESGLVSGYGLSRKYSTSVNLHEFANKTAKLPNWSDEFYQQFLRSNRGFSYDPFVVWMQPAALPTFRKVYGKLNRTGMFLHGLPGGSYNLTIHYKYSVSAFGGSKRFILDTVSWMGPKRHLFLPITYIVLGVILLVFAVVFGLLNYFGPIKKATRRDSAVSYGSTEETYSYKF